VLSRLRLAHGRGNGAMELVIFVGAWALLAIGAVLAGEDSRPRIDRSRDWGLHSWTRGE
jgi:hypothetical protein